MTNPRTRDSHPLRYRFAPRWPFPSNEVHVWLVDVGILIASKGERALSETLSVQEKKRAARFRSERDRILFLGSHAAMRLILGDYLRTDPRTISITQVCERCGGPHGQPKLAPGTDELPQLSLSHSGEMATLAVAHTPVGVDIEQIDVSKSYQEVIDFACSPEEVEYFGSLPEVEKRQAFLVSWTLKEAYLKAQGLGLTDAGREALKSLAGRIGLPSIAEPLAKTRFLGKNWIFNTLRPANEYIAAVVVKGSDINVVNYELPRQVGG